MSESETVITKSRILDLFSELDEAELDSIEQWICSQAYKKDLESKKTLLKTDKILIKIADSIKKIVPFEAEMLSERISPPNVGDQADCNVINTCHVDEFLYDEDAVEDLVKEGKLKRHYCLECNSRNIEDLIFISHSLSRQALQYIFKVLLPKDLEDKQVLDIGSRLGTVLFGGYYISNAGTLIGIEINKECCDVQEKIMGQYSIDNNRVKVVNSDVMDRGDIVANSDIIIINTLDFFVDNDKHREVWHFLKRNIKKGSYLISTRDMIDTLDNLDIYEELINWLTICKPNQLENELYSDVEQFCKLFLYTVN